MSDMHAVLGARWQRLPLADVAEILDNKRLPINSKEREGRQGSVPYYGATGQVGWIDDHIFDEELVLLGEDGAPFLDPGKPKAYIVRGKSWVNNHAHVLRARKVPTAWLHNYLNTINYRDFVTGTTRLKLTQAEMRKIMVPVAPPATMLNVVAEIEKQFSRLDEAVAGLQRVKANLKRYKAAVLKAAVEGRLVPTETELARREGRSFETGAELLQRILETRRRQWQGKGKYKEPAAPDTTDLPELPEGWVWATYAQIGRVTTGFTPPTGDAANFGGDIPFFKPTDLDAADNVVSAREYLSEQGIAKGRELTAGSILVTCIGATIGKTGLARINCATNQQINAVSPSLDGAVSSYIYFWAISPFAQRQILDNASATTLPILNKSKFEALVVALAPLAEQYRIVAEVDRLLSIAREVEAEVDANLKRAQGLRQAILAKAFCGEMQ